MPTLTVQVAFATKPGAATPQWQDITAYVLSVDTKRGRQYENDRIEAGTCSLLLDNSDRRFDPTYPAGPYYPNVLPRKRIRVSATWLGTTYYLFDGYVERWPTAYDGPDWSEVAITATDAFLPLANARIVGSFSQQLTGARVLAILAAAAWPTATSAPASGFFMLGTAQLGSSSTGKLGYSVPTTVLDAGQETIAAVTFADTDDKMALDHIRDCEDTEAGIVFIDGQGRIVFHDRNHRIKTTTAALTFTDDEAVVDSTHIAYRDVVLSFDYDRGANEIRVTRSGGSTQVASTPSLVDDYFRATLPVSNYQVSDARALSMALFLLRQRQDVRDSAGNPRVRVDSVTFDPWAGDVWDRVLVREISDRVTVARTPATHPVGTVQTISTDCFIEAVQHTIRAPNDWSVTFELSPASPAADFWVLGAGKLASSSSSPTPHTVLAC